MLLTRDDETTVRVVNTTSCLCCQRRWVINRSMTLREENGCRIAGVLPILKMHERSFVAKTTKRCPQFHDSEAEKPSHLHDVNSRQDKIGV